MRELRPNEERAKDATMLIWLVLVMEIVSFVSSFFQYIMLKKAEAGEFYTIEEAESNDLREQVIAIIFMIVYIISAVTFIKWFRRAYYNLHLRVNNLDHSEGWAAGSWFTPILSLFRPYQIMRELFQQTKVYFIRNGITVDEKFATVSLGLWWTLWIVNNFIGQFIFRANLAAETIDELLTVTVADMIGNIISVPLAIITVKIIKEYSSVEPQLRMELAEEETEETNLESGTLTVDMEPS